MCSHIVWRRSANPGIWNADQKHSSLSPTFSPKQLYGGGDYHGVMKQGPLATPPLTADRQLSPSCHASLRLHAHRRLLAVDSCGASLPDLHRLPFILSVLATNWFEVSAYKVLLSPVRTGCAARIKSIVNPKNWKHVLHLPRSLQLGSDSAINCERAEGFFGFLDRRRCR